MPRAPNTADDVMPPRALQAWTGVPQDLGRIDLGIGFALAAAAVFVRFGNLHEILTVMVGAKLYLLYIFVLPALLAVVLTGGLRRVFEGRPTIYWTGFALWIALAIPFSTWRGGSVETFIGYLKTGVAMMVVIAGMTTNWRQCKGMMWAFALAGGVSLMAGRLFETTRAGGRLGLDFGSIANANDFAAYLLSLLPFLLWVVLSSRSIVLRTLALPGIGYGLYLILRTASRGAVLALAIGCLFFLWRGTARQRIAFLALAPVALAAVAAFVPRDALLRMRMVSVPADVVGEGVALEAAQSASIREYLVQKGVEYAFEHPLFGVGPGLFASYEGSHEQVFGTHGYWRAAHSSFTEVASECGIPGLLFFVAGILSTLRLLNSTYREARGRPECQDIRTAALCVMLGVVNFCVAAAFLSDGYSAYFPAMGGLAVAIARGAKQEFQSRAVSLGAAERLK
jgi:O-antigen ligase